MTAASTAGAASEVAPAPDPDEFYWIDLIGLSVANREGVALGDVIGLIDTGPHCVLRVKPVAADATVAQLST